MSSQRAGTDRAIAAARRPGLRRARRPAAVPAGGRRRRGPLGTAALAGLGAPRPSSASSSACASSSRTPRPPRSPGARRPATGRAGSRRGWTAWSWVRPRCAPRRSLTWCGGGAGGRRWACRTAATPQAVAYLHVSPRRSRRARRHGRRRRPARPAGHPDHPVVRSWPSRSTRSCACCWCSGCTGASGGSAVATAAAEVVAGARLRRRAGPCRPAPRRAAAPQRPRRARCGIRRAAAVLADPGAARGVPGGRRSGGAHG